MAGSQRARLERASDHSVHPVAMSHVQALAEECASTVKVGVMEETQGRSAPSLHSQLEVCFPKPCLAGVSGRRIYHGSLRFISDRGSSVCLALRSSSSLSCWSLFFMSRKSILRPWGQPLPAS